MAILATSLYLPPARINIRMFSYRRPHLWINILLYTRAHLAASGQLAGGLGWLFRARHPPGMHLLRGASQALHDLGIIDANRQRCARCPRCVPHRGLRYPVYSSRSVPSGVRRVRQLLGDVPQP